VRRRAPIRKPRPGEHGERMVGLLVEEVHAEALRGVALVVPRLEPGPGESEVTREGRTRRMISCSSLVELVIARRSSMNCFRSYGVAPIGHLLRCDGGGANITMSNAFDDL